MNTRPALRSLLAGGALLLALAATGPTPAPPRPAGRPAAQTAASTSATATDSPAGEMGVLPVIAKAPPVTRPAPARQIPPATWNAWAERDPAELAAYAATLPEGTERTQALSAAISEWGLRDPAAVSRWLPTIAGTPEYDAGAAWLVTHTDGANRSPEIAMRWVESIGDAELRFASHAHVRSERAAQGAPMLHPSSP